MNKFLVSTWPKRSMKGGQKNLKGKVCLSGTGTSIIIKSHTHGLVNVTTFYLTKKLITVTPSIKKNIILTYHCLA